MAKRWKGDLRDVWLMEPDLARRIRRTLVACRMGLIAATITIAVMGTAIVMENRKMSAREEARRSAVIERAQGFTNGDIETLERVFDDATALDVKEAIPFAVLYAVQPSIDDGVTMWHVIAARRFLRRQPIELVREMVDGAANELGKRGLNARGLVDRLREVTK